MVLPQILWLMVRSVDPRLLATFAARVGVGGWWAMTQFQRRLRKGVVFPPFLFLSITNRCNLRCQGCWVEVGADEPGELSLADLARLIAAGRRNGSRFFGLLGGEPLLHQGLFDLLARHGDCYFQLFTNGTLVDDGVAERMRRCGNVSPLVSIEGSETVSDVRRGGRRVLSRSSAGLDACLRARLVTGVAASLCQSNLDDLLSDRFLDSLIARGVSYAWYYLYRPAGGNPCTELALTAEQIQRVRRFVVEARARKPILLVDSYWDDRGRAICPAAVGISHHVGPWGDIEPCPPIQFAAETIHDGDVEATIRDSKYLADFRRLAADAGRGCILLTDPAGLATFVVAAGARPSSRRAGDLERLRQASLLPSHHQPDAEIPEKHWAYRFAKKRWFFGFGAYG